MNKKFYDGYIIGKKKLDKNTLYYVETERHKCEGVSADVVFSKKDFNVGDTISYSVKKIERGYICYA